VSVEEIRFRDFTSLQSELIKPRIKKNIFSHRLNSSKDVIDSCSECEKIELVDLILAADFVTDQEVKASTSSSENIASYTPLAQAFIDHGKWQSNQWKSGKGGKLGPASYMLMGTGWGKLLEPLYEDLDQIFESSPVKELSSYLESIIYCKELDDFDTDEFGLTISPFRKELLACFSCEGLVGTVCNLPGNLSAFIKLGNAFAFDTQWPEVIRNDVERSGENNAGGGLLKAMQKLCIPGYSLNTGSVALDGTKVELDQFTHRQRRLLTQLIFHSLSGDHLQKFERPDEEGLVFEIIEAIPMWLSNSFAENYYESPRECQVNGNALFTWVNHFLWEALLEGYKIENADLLLSCLFKTMERLPPNQLKLYPLLLMAMEDEVAGDSGKDICALFEVFDHVTSELRLARLADSGVRICQRFFRLNLLSLADSLISLWLICALRHGFTLPRSDWLTGKIISLLSQDSNTQRAIRYILNDQAMALQFEESMPFLAFSIHKVLRQKSSISGAATVYSIAPPNLVSDEIWIQLNTDEQSQVTVLQKYLTGIKFSDNLLLVQEDRRGFIITFGVLVESSLKKILSLLIEDISKKTDISEDLKELVKEPMLGKMIMLISEPSNKKYLKKHPEWADVIRKSSVYKKFFGNTQKRRFLDTLVEIRNKAAHDDSPITDEEIWSCSYHVKAEDLVGKLLLAAREPISITSSHAV